MSLKGRKRSSGSHSSEPFLAQARKSRPFKKLRSDTLNQARDSRSSEDPSVSTTLPRPASQTQQVFYVSDPINKKWSIVLFTNKIIINNIDDQEDIDVEDDPFFGISLSHVSGPITANDDLYTRGDHDEGLWILSSGVDYGSGKVLAPRPPVIKRYPR
ncbi:hypothetical protein Lal_00014138 [Lupinus albus]|nr:hypothetical protein Lal_00014138 [Lupinus albus]